MKMGFLLSVSIRVHPWLDHIGCGFAALRCIAGCHPAGPRPGRDAGTPPKPCRFCNRRYSRLAICARLNRYVSPEEGEARTVPERGAPMGDARTVPGNSHALWRGLA